MERILEINALEEVTKQVVEAARESDDLITLTGAWRLWNEHPSSTPQVQEGAMVG